MEQTNSINKEANVQLDAAMILGFVYQFHQSLLKDVALSTLYESIGNQLRQIFPEYTITIAALDTVQKIEHFIYHCEQGVVTSPEPQKYNRLRNELIDTGRQILVNSHAAEFVENILGHNYSSISGIPIPKSFLFAPFVVEGEVKGYISLKHYEKESVFEDLHVVLLKTISGAISLALKNEILLQEAKQNAEEQHVLLETMNDLTNQPDLSLLLETVLQRAIGLLKVTGGELAIYHEETKMLEVVTCHNLGMTYKGVQLALGEGALGTVASTREPLLIPDYQRWANRSNQFSQTIARCVMAVPLLLGEQLVGVLCAVHLEEDRIFGDEDMRLLNLFAPIAATAIHNARLFDAEQRKAAEQIALLDTMRDMSSKLDLQVVLQSVVERSVELLHVTGGELAIYHSDREELEIVASYNIGSDTRGVRMRLGEGAMGYTAKSLSPMIIPDYQIWDGRSDKYTSTPVRGVMVVPLLSKGKLVGVLCSVDLEGERLFVQSDLRMLNLFAPLAATAIENALLFEQTTQLLKVSEQREATLKKTQEQLVQQEKLASLGEVTAGIAHEIQNPLNFVNNFSEVSCEMIDELMHEIADTGKDDALDIAQQLKQNLDKINHHGKRADSIVKGMLMHSRANGGQKEPTNINALCDEYLRLAYHGLRAKDKSFNAKLEIALDDSIGLVEIIPQEIGRVMLNLINNAFYAINERKMKASEEYDPTVRIITQKLHDRVEIRIQDNGTGIPQKVIDKIFQPFFTTKPTGQGTGLGLSLSYDIVKAHGGELSVDTNPDYGTSFIISIPIN